VDVILAGECVMTLVTPGVLYLLLMRIPGIAQAVRRVQQWQREHDIAQMCE
jgi:hypothetical protein